MEKAFDFLNVLSENNNREWFKNHRPLYEHALEEAVAFADKLLDEMNKHDVLEPTSGKRCLYRIYRDVRFSQDKTPYQTSWDGRFRRAGKVRRGGYYFHLEPGNTFIVGGFWQPNSNDILHIRKQIQQDPEPLQEVLNSTSFKQYFGELKGNKLKTAPRGFHRDVPNIELLRHKSLILKHRFPEQEVLKPNFHLLMNSGFKKMRPFLDYMSDILTTDLNGEPLI